MVVRVFTLVNLFFAIPRDIKRSQDIESKGEFHVQGDAVQP